MGNNQLELQKETLFKDAVLSAAESKSMEIIAKAQEKSNRIIEETKRECELPDQEEVQAQQGKSGERELAAALAEARRSLLFHRSVLVDEIFADVAEKLLEFAGDDEYEKWLLGKIKASAHEAGSKNTGKDAAEVFLRSVDMKYGPVVEKALPGCVVTKDDTIKLGGAKVRFGRVLYNQTLDEALLNAKEQFYTESRLNI